MKLIVYIILSVFSINTYGQALDLKAIYSTSTWDKFKNNIGIGLSFNQFQKSGNKLGIEFQACYNNRIYDNNYGDSEAMYMFITKVKSHNSQYAIKLDYGFNILNNQNSNIYFGPQLGLNYFKVYEETSRIQYGEIPAEKSDTTFAVNNKLSTGLLIEYEIRNVLIDNLATFFTFQPELFWNPSRHGRINFDIGIRYIFK